MLEPLEDLPARLEALQPKDWQPLFDLIPEIEKTESFGEWMVNQPGVDGYPQFPFMAKGPLVHKFFKLVDEMEIVPAFDYMDWEEGRRMYKHSDVDIDSWTVIDVCKMFTYYIRADRFSDGALCSAFENGQILRLLKHLEKLVK